MLEIDELPKELPKIRKGMKKKEAYYTKKIYQILDKHYGNYIAEIKVDNRKFSEYQKTILTKASTGRYTVKIPDSAVGKVSVDIHSYYKVDSLAVILGTDKKELEIYNYKDKTTKTLPYKPQ